MKKLVLTYFSLLLLLLAACAQQAPEAVIEEAPATVEEEASGEVAAGEIEQRPDDVEEPETAMEMGGAGAVGARPEIPVLRLAGGTDWGYPNPFGFQRGPGYIHSSFIFDTLLWKDAEGKMIPWLAESWTSSDDGLTWVFTLHEGARWHDGAPVTPEDVVFSFEYENSHPTGFPLAISAERATVTRTGEREVTFTLNEPFAPFLTNLAGAMQIIPRHIWEVVEDPQSFRGPEAVIGSGPYTLGEYNPEDGSYLYLANDDFYLGSPAVERLEFLPVGDAVLALTQGEIDAGGPGVQGGVTEDVLAQLSEPPFVSEVAPGEWTMLLKFNMTREPFDDVRLRQAVAHALDLEDMVERLLLGQGEPGSAGWLSPANPWYNPDVENYAYDPDRARSLLDEMELVDNDGDGVRELADGTPLSFDLPYASFDSPRNAELIQSYLAEVGIQIAPVSVDRGTRDQIAVEGNYDMILVGHGGLGGDPDFMRTVFHSNSQSRSFIRPHGWQNEQFDALAGQQLRMTDSTMREEMVAEMQASLAQEVPVLALYYPTRYWFYDASVLDGWHFTPGGLASGIPMMLDKYLFVAGDAVVLEE